MVTYFNFVGNVGKIIVRAVKNGNATFLSVATTEYYNKKYHSQWINNVVAYGPLGKLMADKIVPGNKIYISGTIKIFKRGKLDVVTFVVDIFRIVQQTDEQKAEWMQKQAIENLPSDEDMYNDNEGDVGDLPY